MRARQGSEGDDGGRSGISQRDRRLQKAEISQAFSLRRLWSATFNAQAALFLRSSLSLSLSRCPSCGAHDRL